MPSNRYIRARLELHISISFKAMHTYRNPNCKWTPSLNKLKIKLIKILLESTLVSLGPITHSKSMLRMIDSISNRRVSFLVCFRYILMYAAKKI